MRICAVILVICLPGLLVATRAARCEEGPAAAAAALRAKGLSPEGHVWITAREAAYRRAADSLEAAERRHQQALKQSADIRARNEQLRATLAAAEEAERAQKKQPPPAAPAPTADPRAATSQPGETAAKLNSTMIDVTGRGEQTPLQLAMIELATARTAAQLAVLKMIQGGKAVEADYAALRADPGVAAAIKQIKNAKLGPLRNYQRDLARAQTLAPAIFSPEIPCFVESGRFRLMAIVGEAHPLTLSIDAGEAPLRITTSAAQRLGVVPTDATQELRIGQRSVTARPVVLNSVRIGPALLKKVPALVLPPEAEDLGSWISPGAIVGWNAPLNERGMTLQLSPKK